MYNFYWPTRIIIVDDDKEFLYLLKDLIFKDYDQIVLFDNVNEALDFIKKNNEVSITSHFSEFTEDSFSNRGISVDLSKSFSLANNKQKYDLISLIICDYDMPLKSGIDFFKEVSKICNAKKILLTGKFSPREAIDFKGNIIDDYIEKDHRESFVDKLNNKINHQIKEYFNNFVAPLNHLIKNNVDSSILENLEFIDYFKRICCEKRIIERYLIDYTGIYYLIADVHKYILFIQDENQLQETIVEYSDLQDKNLLEKLISKKYQAAQFEEGKIIYPAANDLAQYIYPIDKIVANKYYISLISLTDILNI